MLRYKDHEITRTNTTTSVRLPNPGGKLGTYEAIRYLYRIEGKLGKEEGKRPFITSQKEAKAFISKQIEMGMKMPSTPEMRKLAGWDD
mgnify:CR=1 FL=1